MHQHWRRSPCVTFHHELGVQPQRLPAAVCVRVHARARTPLVCARAGTREMRA